MEHERLFAPCPPVPILICEIKCRAVDVEIAAICRFNTLKHNPLRRRQAACKASCTFGGKEVSGVTVERPLESTTDSSILDYRGIAW
jgi:hypothetical protein